MRRQFTALLFTFCVLLTALSILVGFSQFSGRLYLGYGRALVSSLSFLSGQTVANSTQQETAAVTSPSQYDLRLKDGNSTFLETAPVFIKAIVLPEDSTFARLECPAPMGERYKYLRSGNTSAKVMDARSEYFFALDLHQCASLLPRLMGSIVETMRFLGPEHCVLSIVEGRSDDGTFEILKLLRTEIEGIGARYFFKSSDVDPTAADRIMALAELRNQALEPLTKHPDQYSENTTVVFINDVSICMEDILELIHQRLYQNADMTCGMDWTYVGPDPTFYDVWIARGMNGDSFFNIPEDGIWNFAWNLFWNDPETLALYNAHRPFQVFSCWNGAAVFTAKPLLESKVAFRSKVRDECFQGEPQLFCKEMWHLGYLAMYYGRVG